ncbi:SDR family NAD(P)-dependent oxidoreductase [Paenibacillus thalictri]|uniref:SDR family oxidoreductase n=1 Tax=Paenibacillus thalictri TaxID=2527873 RepID=A0A4Q9DNE6_9BACL|nr:SDR family oxidoreductase [Paenibacillus thalictri]TBL73973.1 SDR family oxidoreductase [Paenibacillus thalictri]
MNIWELFGLKGKVALITGGARNLGFDMAEALAEAGADVAITSRRLADAQTSAESLAGRTGRRVLPLQVDVGSEEQVERMVRDVLAEFGRIDILINNAGNVTSTPETGPLEKRSLEDWNEVILSNMTGTFLCVKHVSALAMIPQQSGSIINVGSVTGIIGKDRRVYAGTSMGGATIDYHAAKGGVISMTRDMAVYLAPQHIRVNCISPGGFLRGQPEPFVKAYSETIPMGRMGQDGKEIKGAALYLASEASSYVTGHNLVVDGGLTIW